MGAHKTRTSRLPILPGIMPVSPVPFLSMFKSDRVTHLASAAGASWAVTAVSAFDCSGAGSVLDSC